MDPQVLRCPGCKNVVPIAAECRVCGESLSNAAQRQSELDRQYGYSLQAVESHRQRRGLDLPETVFLVLSILSMLSGLLSTGYLVLTLAGNRGNGEGNVGMLLVIGVAAFFILVGLPVLSLLNVKGARKAQFALLSVSLVLGFLNLMSLANSRSGTSSLIPMAIGFALTALYLWSIRAVGNEPVRPPRS